MSDLNENLVIESQKNKRNRRLLIGLVVVAAGMFGFSYVMVPFYNLLCDAWGLNGKTNQVGVGAASAAEVDKNRTVTVEFVTQVYDNLPWIFKPEIKTVKVHPGENTKVAFFAENQSNQPMIVRAIPGVTPGIAGKYLRKTECFCFQEQKLGPHDKADMPVLFHVDRGLPANIRTITLSYSLFNAELTKARGIKPAGKIS